MFHFSRTADPLAFSQINLPNYAKLVGAAALLLVTLAWLLADPAAYLLASAPVSAADRSLILALRDLASPAVIETMAWVSRPHGTAGILALGAVLAIWLLKRGLPALLPVLLAGVPGGLLLNAAIKNAVERARPESIYVAERLSSFSFPSGHTAGATLVYGFAVMVLWPLCRSRRARAAVLVTATVLVMLVASSRVMLGMHYPSDCAAAMVEATLWLAICMGAAKTARS